MLSSFLVGAAFSGGLIFTPQFIFGALSVIFLVIGFNSYNSIYDKPIDLINKPHRPLPSGRFSESQVFLISGISFILSLSFALFINSIFLFIALFGLILAIIYSHPLAYLKKFTLIGTVIGNLTFAIIYPLEGWALSPTLPIPWYLILFLLIAGMGTAILKDFEDLDGDKTHRIKTMPVIFGHSFAAKLVTFVFLLSILTIILFIYFGILPLKYSLIIILLFLATCNAYLLNSDERKHISRRAFLIGMALLTLITLSLTLLKIL